MNSSCMSIEINQQAMVHSLYPWRCKQSIAKYVLHIQNKYCQAERQASEQFVFQCILYKFLLKRLLKIKDFRGSLS